MKSNSDIKPQIIQDLGNGSFYYNYNIVKKKSVNEFFEERTTYNYDTVQVWNKPTYEKIVRAVIRSEIDETKEFSLINDYNAALLDIIDGVIKDKAIAEYREYLNRVIEIKAMVRADLQAAGY